MTAADPGPTAAPRGRLDRPARRLVAWSGALAFATSLAGFAWQLRPDGRLTWVTASPVGDAAGAIAANVALFSLFALHHSVFARLGIKQWLTTRIPQDLERPTYVWISSILFALVWLFWQPVPGELWRVAGTAGAWLAWAPVAGIVVTLHAARGLDVFELAGVRRAPAAPGESRDAGDPAPLVVAGLYRVVRHPIYLGWLLLVWPTPVMTGTRLVFAAVSTAYLITAIPLEERGLVATFGRRYDDYRRQVRWRLIPFVY